MIHVVNRRSHATTPNDVYVGRSGYRPSPLGNPYSVWVTKSTHQVATIEEALIKYERHLSAKIMAGDDQVLAALEDIAERAEQGDVYLVCHCVNERNKKLCHAFTIKRVVEAMLEKRREAPTTVPTPD